MIPGMKLQFLQLLQWPSFELFLVFQPFLSTHDVATTISCCLSHDIFICHIYF
jgi:hypothetical protein